MYKTPYICRAADNSVGVKRRVGEGSQAGEEGMVGMRWEGRHQANLEGPHGLQGFKM